MGQAAESKYIARRLAGDLWTIEEPGVRCFLIYDSNEAMLIDACASGGMAFHDTVRSVIGNTPISIVLTHADHDHFGGVPQKGSPSLHPAEFDRYRKSRPLSAGSDRLGAAREGYLLSCGRRRLEVLHIPGHTPGSIALLDTDNRCIFSGDSISTSHVYMFGEGRNLEAYIDSLAWIEAVSDRFDRFYCAHGDADVPISHLAVQKEAAEKLLSGKLAGTAPPVNVSANVMLYKHKNAAFLY